MKFVPGRLQVFDDDATFDRFSPANFSDQTSKVFGESQFFARSESAAIVNNRYFRIRMCDGIAGSRRSRMFRFFRRKIDRFVLRRRRRTSDDGQLAIVDDVARERPLRDEVETDGGVWQRDARFAKSRKCRGSDRRVRMKSFGFLFPSEVDRRRFVVRLSRRESSDRSDERRQLNDVREAKL